MADQIVPCPEEFRARFEEAVATDNRIQDEIQEAKLKRDTLWLEIAKKLDARDKALIFDKTEFTITIRDKEDDSKKMLDMLRGHGDTESGKFPVGLDKTMGSVLPTIQGLKPALLKRLKKLFKR